MKRFLLLAAAALTLSGCVSGGPGYGGGYDRYPGLYESRPAVVYRDGRRPRPPIYRDYRNDRYDRYDRDDRAFWRAPPRGPYRGDRRFDDRREPPRRFEGRVENRRFDERIAPRRRAEVAPPIQPRRIGPQVVRAERPVVGPGNGGVPVRRIGPRPYTPPVIGPQ